MTRRARFIFTVTGGRTGTETLARYFKGKFGFLAVHEPLDIDDIGVRMPDIKLLRTFNDRGNTPLVQNFYKHKFDELTDVPAYIETNHTLAKCGLIENLVLHPVGIEAAIILLKRNKVPQCASYMRRRDFNNYTIIWQWYLDYHYANVIVNPYDFAEYSEFGQALWYCFEMEARQHYYRSLFSDRLLFIDCQLEDLNNPAGLNRFLADLDLPAVADSVGVYNENNAAEDCETSAKLAGILAHIRVDVREAVDAYIASGKRLDRPLVA